MNAADVARTYLGTPFKHQGRTPGIGLDCIGMVGCAGLALGNVQALAWSKDERWKGYDKRPDGRSIEQACDEFLLPIPVREAGLGDILLLRWHIEAYPHHFAIISRVDPPYIIHAYRSAKKVVENRLDGIWRSRIVKAYRFR